MSSNSVKDLGVGYFDVDNAITTVVDVTYLCNATCRYCQWGNQDTPGRTHRELPLLLIPKETLLALGTNRVVLSGGEPRLHPRLSEILRYYKNLVPQVIVITNGYGLDSGEMSRLVEAGATGVTVSLDSVYADESQGVRMTPRFLHEQILSNLRRIASSRACELGINSVVAHPTANWRTVLGLLDFASEIKADFLKFQPIFDDGYVSRNAPHLKLSERDFPALREISERVGKLQLDVSTNPAGFWRDIAFLAAGEALPAGRCSLGPRQSLSVQGKLKICYWVESSTLGASTSSLEDGIVRKGRVRFEDDKLRCHVGFHCFCTQNLSHEWRKSSE